MRIFVVSERRWFFQMCLTITLTLTASDTTNDDSETVETWLRTGLWTVNNRPTLHCRDFLSCQRLWDDTGMPWRRHTWPLYIMIHYHLITTNNNSSTALLLILMHIITVQTRAILVLELILVLVFILFWVNNFYFYTTKINSFSIYIVYM